MLRWLGRANVTKYFIVSCGLSYQMDHNLHPLFVSLNIEDP